MKRVLTLAQMTFLEFLREKILILILFFSVCSLGIAQLLGALSLDEQFRIMVHFGSSSQQLLMVALAGFIGASVLHREIERQTCLVVMSRPVTRTDFLYGKFLGISLLILCFSVLGALLHFLLLDGDFSLSSFLFMHFSILIEALFVLSLAFFCGTFLRPVVGVGLTATVWLAAHWQSDFLFFASKSKSPFLHFVAAIFKWGLPPLEGLNVRSVHFLQLTQIDWDRYLMPLSALFCWSFLVIQLARFVWRKRDLV